MSYLELTTWSRSTCPVDSSFHPKICVRPFGCDYNFIATHQKVLRVNTFYLKQKNRKITVVR